MVLFSINLSSKYNTKIHKYFLGKLYIKLLPYELDY